MRRDPSCFGTNPGSLTCRTAVPQLRHQGETVHSVPSQESFKAVPPRDSVISEEPLVFTEGPRRVDKTSVAGGLAGILALLRAGLDSVLRCDQLHNS